MKTEVKTSASSFVIPVRYRCPEHGLSDATWKADSRMRAGGHFACGECARLNVRTTVNAKKNRERALKWYHENRKKKLQYEAKRRKLKRLEREATKCARSRVDPFK